MNYMCTLHVADYKATLFKITSFLQIQKVLISTTTISLLFIFSHALNDLFLYISVKLAFRHDVIKREKGGGK